LSTPRTPCALLYNVAVPSGFDEARSAGACQQTAHAAAADVGESQADLAQADAPVAVEFDTEVGLAGVGPADVGVAEVGPADVEVAGVA